MKDTGLADRLRARGLTVIEVDGWQDRGRTYATFAPRGSVNHHTAGPTGSNAPSLGICINGRSDLPGPLCNAFMARNLDVYVIAGGVANHAGRGGWNGLSGNQTVHGLEIENDGVTEPATEALMDTAARVHAAFLEAPGSSRDAAFTCEHFEWSTEGKIDFHDWPGADLRARVAAHLAGVIKEEGRMADAHRAHFGKQEGNDPATGQPFTAIFLVQPYYQSKRHLNGDEYAAYTWLDAVAESKGEARLLIDRGVHTYRKSVWDGIPTFGTA